MGTLNREYMPGVGEAWAFKGSGVPYGAASALCPPGFSVGDYIKVGKKTFVLGKAGGSITSLGLGVKNGLCQGIAFAAVAASADAGATAVSLTAAGTDGALGDGTIAADEFKGGEAVFFTAGSDIPQRRGVIGNTAVAFGGGACILTLDSPLTTALTVSTDHGEAMQNLWSYCVQDSNINHPSIGFPLVTATSGQYLWIQTGGPIFGSPQAGVGIAGAQSVYWRHDGSLDVRGNIGTYVTDVVAGWVMAESSTGTQAAPFIWLTVFQG